MTNSDISKWFQLEIIVGFSENYVKVLVVQSCPTLCDPMDYGPPGSSAHEISQARILD